MCAAIATLEAMLPAPANSEAACSVICSDGCKVPAAGQNAPTAILWAVEAFRLPTLAMVGLRFGWTLGNTVLVETVFDWPGIGLYATKAIVTQDFMPVIGVTLSIGVIFVTVNLVVDLLYGVINPKVRYE